jgi:hypothetical protein
MVPVVDKVQMDVIATPHVNSMVIVALIIQRFVLMQQPPLDHVMVSVVDKVQMGVTAMNRA